jgi:hypothetical protein
MAEDGFQVSSMTALSEASALKPALSKKDAEALIQSLVSDYWIVNRFAFQEYQVGFRNKL